ncbi:hypothetical protein [Sphingomonas arenae]|uniref:hypothetical protein n=1 Tax=Sphingomonas arenae TaxID=2812555 RepID=UPI0019689641|nr:hypothetical protein [Sphingomonas arenae]
MTTPAPGTVPCAVDGAALLPADTGGEQALCAEIRRATAEVLPAGARIAVQVVSDHRMHATAILADGRALRRVSVAVSDRTLSTRSFRMIAEALAQQLRSTKS